MVVRENIFEKFRLSENKGNRKASHANIQGNINVLRNYQKNLLKCKFLGLFLKDLTQEILGELLLSKLY